jgi:hypothetical protein
MDAELHLTSVPKEEVQSDRACFSPGQCATLDSCAIRCAEIYRPSESPGSASFLADFLGVAPQIELFWRYSATTSEDWGG